MADKTEPRLAVNCFSVAGIVINPVSGTAQSPAGGRVQLTPKEMQLLVQLALHAGNICTHRMLIDAVWKGNYLVGDTALPKVIYKLRRSLSDLGLDQHIKSVPRRGYLLDAEISLIEGRAADEILVPGAAIPGRDHWRLERRLAHKRSGQVWLVRHSKTGQPRVFKFCEDEKALAALKRETSVFRIIKHSLGERCDINRIIDWNFANPPYYVESEYVDGTSLQHWLNNSAKKPDLNEKIKLVARTAEALYAAHSLGILHRDIKPSNIMVRARDGKPVLIDFGTAGVNDEELLSRLAITSHDLNNEGSQIGSPMYRAPELFGGDAPSPQSDIYSLGIVLFQLLVDDFTKFPLPGWDRSIPDLILKEDLAVALDGQAHIRFSDAAQFALALRTYRERSATRAAETSHKLHMQRLKRFRRRATMVIVLTLTFGLVMFAQERKATRLARQAQTESQIATAVTDYMVQLFKFSNPGNHRAGTISAVELLHHGWMTLSNRLDGRPYTKARILMAIGKAFNNLGEYDRAEMVLNEALHLHQADENPSKQTAKVLFQLSKLRFNQGDFDQAIDLRLEAVNTIKMVEHTPLDLLRVRSSLVGIYLKSGDIRGAENVLEDLVGSMNEVRSSDKMLYSQIVASFGTLRWKQGRYAEAVEFLAEALEIEEDLLGPDHLSLARSLHNYALPQANIGRLEEAEAALERGIKILRKHLPEDHPYIAYYTGTLAAVFDMQGRHDKAFETYQKGYHLAIARLSEDHHVTSYLRGGLAKALLEKGRVEEARTLASATLRDDRKNLTHRSPLLATSLILNARIHKISADYDPGRELLAEAAQLIEEKVGRAHPMYGEAIGVLSELELLSGNREAAESYAKEAIALLADNSPPNDIGLEEAQRTLAFLQY